MSKRHLKVIVDTPPGGIALLDFALMLRGGGVYTLTYRGALAAARDGSMVQCGYGTSYLYNIDADCLLSVDNGQPPYEVEVELGWRIVPTDNN